jgi:hypothetical protein
MSLCRKIKRDKKRQYAEIANCIEKFFTECKDLIKDTNLIDILKRNIDDLEKSILNGNEKQIKVFKRKIAINKNLLFRAKNPQLEKFKQCENDWRDFVFKLNEKANKDLLNKKMGVRKYVEFARFEEFRKMLLSSYGRIRKSKRSLATKIYLMKLLRVIPGNSKLNYIPQELPIWILFWYNITLSSVRLGFKRYSIKKREAMANQINTANPVFSNLKK